MYAYAWHVFPIEMWFISYHGLYPFCVLYSSYSLRYHDINDMYMYIWYCVFKFCEINDVYIVFPIYYSSRRIAQCKLLVLGRYFTKRVALFPGPFSRWQLLTRHNCYTLKKFLIYSLSSTILTRSSILNVSLCDEIYHCDKAGLFFLWKSGKGRIALCSYCTFGWSEMYNFYSHQFSFIASFFKNG